MKRKVGRPRGIQKSLVGVMMSTKQRAKFTKMYKKSGLSCYGDFVEQLLNNEVK